MIGKRKGGKRHSLPIGSTVKDGLSLFCILTFLPFIAGIGWRIFRSQSVWKSPKIVKFCKYCKNDTFWVIFQHRGCCCMPWKLWCSVKREKKWLLPEDDGLHLLGNCDHIFFWERKFFMTGIRTRHPFPIGKPKESEAPSEQVKKEWLFPIYVGYSFLTF